MRGIFEKWLVGAVVNFILRQLEKFTTETNWETVAKDAEARVRDLVPGTWFDDEAAALVVSIVRTAHRAFRNETSLERIIQLLADQKYHDAAQSLKDCLLKAWTAQDFLEGVKERGEVQVASKAKSLVESYRPVA